MPESAACPPAAPTRPASTYVRVGKRAIDILVIALVSPCALAIGLPIALWNAAVFRNPRRIFFVQERVGRGGRTFRMVKFRTMREARRSAVDSWFNGEDQARVTRFGRLLRNTHLDELPQLLNILAGHMHLVGPRPEMPDIHAWACGGVAGFEQRLAVRPGLTGLAQITQGYTGASFECYAEKLAIDTDYIRRVSLATDLGIVLRTVPWVLQGRGWNWNRAKRGSGAAAEPLSEPVSTPLPGPLPAPLAGPLAGPLKVPAARPHATAPTSPSSAEARYAPADAA